MSEQNAEKSQQTAREVTQTNAGQDAIMGTVADQPPADPDNPPLGENAPAAEGELRQQPEDAEQQES